MQGTPKQIAFANDLLSRWEAVASNPKHYTAATLARGLEIARRAAKAEYVCDGSGHRSADAIEELLALCAAHAEVDWDALNAGPSRRRPEEMLGNLTRDGGSRAAAVKDAAREIAARERREVMRAQAKAESMW
jgi:hypothetical protein